jgi:isorenieratene synthase
LKNSVSNDEKSFNVVKTLYSSAKTIGLAPPYKVMRVFFKGQLNDSRPDILETPQHRPFNLIARYDLLEDEFQKLRQEKNVTCIEFHMYTIKKEWVGISDPLLLWKLASPVAFEIYPELEQMETVGFTLGEHYNFPSYAKGLESVRPKTGEAYTLGLKNLALAGDWIKTDYPSALMERATITGREAANHILFMDNVRQAPLVVANNYGPGPF